MKKKDLTFTIKEIVNCIKLYDESISKAIDNHDEYTLTDIFLTYAIRKKIENII